MIISCTTNTLNKALQTVLRAISSKPSTPIFSGVHLIAQNNTLEIQAMDMNMAISSKIEAMISEDGKIVVSARKFSELIRRLDQESISLSQDKDKNLLIVTSGKSEYRLPLMNEEDYPKFPYFVAEKTIAIEEEKISDLIKKTIFACSNEETRPLFTGILVEVNQEKITFVATNTHRLAIKALEQTNEETTSIIIPSKVLGEIAHNLTNDLPESVKISTLATQIMVEIGEVVIISRLIEGKFPDYRRVIPPKFSVNTEVNIKELANAVERVALFSTDGEYSVIKVVVEENEMTIMSSSPEIGAGKEIIPCQTMGESLKVAFNAKYILDILKNLESETAILSFNTSLSPVCVKSPEDENYTYIITPVRVVF